jgi:hypothetical protein
VWMNGARPVDNPTTHFFLERNHQASPAGRGVDTRFARRFA